LLVFAKNERAVVGVEQRKSAWLHQQNELNETLPLNLQSFNPKNTFAFTTGEAINRSSFIYSGSHY
jgi:hypothetical protein